MQCPTDGATTFFLIIEYIIESRKVQGTLEEKNRGPSLQSDFLGGTARLDPGVLQWQREPVSLI